MIVVLVLALSLVSSQTEESDVAALRKNCRLVLQTHKAALPPSTAKELAALVEAHGKPAADIAERVQKLLDPHCLVEISINPESRVKAIRGAAPAQLTLNRETLFLLKIQNDAGVTHAVKVTGPQLVRPDEADRQHWLEAVIKDPSHGGSLSGQKVEYVLLGLTAREPGKREATLKFDVGQGTQDLGFRAEVPILFTIRQARSPNRS
jgi:hypothetical protein